LIIFRKFLEWQTLLKIEIKLHSRISFAFFLCVGIFPVATMVAGHGKSDLPGISLEKTIQLIRGNFVQVG
jgi:hypothetical protein